MNKKDLKWYETPAMEVVDLKLEGFLCASGAGDGGVDGGDGGDSSNYD